MEYIFELQNYKIERNKPSLKSNLDNFNINLDSYKLMTNNTYKICNNNKMNNLLLNAKILVGNKEMSGKLEKEYNSLARKNKIHCGLSTSYKFDWNKLKYVRDNHLNQNCNGFIESNYKLLNFMGKICDKYDQLPRNMQHAAPKVRKGVIYTGSEKHFKNIYLSILSHRLIVNSNLPIEVWINYYELGLCLYTLETIDGVRCKVFPEVIHSFRYDMYQLKSMTHSLFFCYFTRSKFYALLFTELTDVLYMDSDALILSDVDEIFNSVEYINTGFILWPDIYGLDCYDSKIKFNSKTRGFTSFPSHILYKHGIGGLSFENSYLYSQEAETGQLVINLNRHKGLIQLCLYYSEIQYLYSLVNGDKDIFRLVFLMMGEPFKFVEYLPDITVANNLKRANFIHYWHYHTLNYQQSTISVRGIVPLDKTMKQVIINRAPFFIHQLKYQDPTALRNVYTMKNGSFCAPTFWPLNIGNWEKIVLPYEKHYEKLVSELYTIVDADWRILTQFSIDRPVRYMQYSYVYSVSLVGWFIDKLLH